MAKTWDFHLRVPPSLVAPLMELVTERDGVTVIHIGQTESDTTSRAPRSASSDTWATKHAVEAIKEMRRLINEGNNAKTGVFYLDVGDALVAQGLITKRTSVSPIFTILTRAGKIKKVSRGRYLPIVP